MAMSMTEDDKGAIWSVTYPQSGVVSYDPATKKFRDYGQVYKQNWSQYPRFIAADDTGWIYFSLGNTASQIVSLDPESGKATPILPEDAPKKESASSIAISTARCMASRCNRPPTRSKTGTNCTKAPPASSMGTTSSSPNQ